VLVISFAMMWIECELEEMATFVRRKTSSRSRLTVPTRLKAFITETALETQFCEPGNPFNTEIEF